MTVHNFPRRRAPLTEIQTQRMIGSRTMEIWQDADLLHRVLRECGCGLPLPMIVELQCARARVDINPSRDDSIDRAMVRYLVKHCRQLVWNWAEAEANPQLEPVI